MRPRTDQEAARFFAAGPVRRLGQPQFADVTDSRNVFDQRKKIGALGFLAKVPAGSMFSSAHGMQVFLDRTNRGQLQFAGCLRVRHSDLTLHIHLNIFGPD